MKVLSLTEIKNWKTFEDLIANYFREVKRDNEFNIDDVIVQPTGTGSDGGRDILVTFTVDDSVMTFQRKWVVQCKCKLP
ncbi:MAG: restriction endonuclease [Cytophagales bacterium]|nr:restriction endonuclease [Cytophagales bacterium]